MITKELYVNTHTRELVDVLDYRDGWVMLYKHRMNIKELVNADYFQKHYVMMWSQEFYDIQKKRLQDLDDVKIEISRKIEILKNKATAYTHAQN